MLRRITVFVFLYFLLALGAVAQEEQDFEQAYEEYREAYGAAETPLEKVHIIHNFLTRFPETQYTVPLVNLCIRHLVNELDDAEGAVELVDSVLAEVVGAETNFEVKKLKVGLLGRLGRAEGLVALVAELSEDRELDFNELYYFASAAIEAEVWELVVELCDASLRLATPEAFRATYPDQEFSDERAQGAARYRVGLSQYKRGWALANMARTDEAISAFEEAEEIINFTYLGYPENELYLYWGRVLLEQGDPEAAIEKLSLGAVLGGREGELNTLREAYAALNGGDDGFDEFVAETRASIAVPVDDFTLPNYSGGELTFSSLRGNVVLLNFWNPT